MGTAVATAHPDRARDRLVEPAQAPARRPGHLDRAGPARAYRAGPAGRRRIPAALLVLGMAVLGVGAARPRATVPVPSNSTTIMLALDTSGSMCSTDVCRTGSPSPRKPRSRSSSPRPAECASVWSRSPEWPACWCRRQPTAALITAIQNLSTARGTAIGAAILTAIDGIAAVDPSVAPTGVDLGVAAAAGLRARRHRSAHRRGEHPGGRAGRPRRSPPPAGSASTPSVSAPRHPRGWPAPARRSKGSTAAGAEAAVASAAGAVGRRRRPNPLIIDESALQDVAKTTGGQYYRAQNADQLKAPSATCPATSQWRTRRSTSLPGSPASADC